MNEPDPPDPYARLAAPARGPELGSGAGPGAVPGGLAGRLPASERATDGTHATSDTAAGSGSTDGARAGATDDPGHAAEDVAAAHDRTLMRDWCAGDPDAFERLYARHRGPLYRYVLNGCSDAGRAQELFQDIWLRVIDARERYAPDAPFRAWLYRIARNRLIDHYRRQPDARHEPFDEETMGSITEIAPPLSPEEVASLIERGDVLHAALRRLPAAQREAIVLQHVAGMRVAEIADVVGENVETVRSRLRYALVKLRGQLRAGA